MNLPRVAQLVEQYEIAVSVGVGEHRGTAAAINETRCWPGSGITEASNAIHRADQLIFIGYSLATTDMHSTVLFRTSVKQEGLKTLIVVNPDPVSRRRTRDVVQRGISKKTRVLSFGSFGEFVAADASLWALT